MSSNDPQAKFEAVRLAATYLGPVSAERLSEFIAERYHLTIPPPVIAVIKASLADRDKLAARRKATAEPPRPPC